MTRAAKVRKNASRAGGDAKPKPAPPAWGVAIVLAAAIGVVYGPFLGVPFVLDDVSAIVDNSSIRSLSPLIGSAEHPAPLMPPRNSPTAGRPLVNLSFAINYSFGSLRPDGYHLFNAAIHFLSALALCAIIRRTLLLPYFQNRFDEVAGWLAFAVALVWALHPLQTEAVIYATQRTELMVALFYFATLYFSLRYWTALPLPLAEARGEGELSPGNRRRRTAWLALATLACWCGMASKEVMVSAPLMVLLFERTFIAGSLPNAVRRSWRLYAGLASAWLLLLALNFNRPRHQSAGFHLDVGAADWWLTQCKVLLIYLKLVLWPSPLLFHYELPYLKTWREAWIYVLPVLLLGLATLILLWRNRPLGYLGIWVFAILAPTSLVPIVTEMAAERRMYLPLAAIVVLLVVGGYALIQAWIAGRQTESTATRGGNRALATTMVAASFLTLTYGIASAGHLNTYCDPMLLWGDVLRHQPQNSLAHLNVGQELSRRRKWDEATKYLKTAVELRPIDPTAINGLGLALAETGRLEEAVDACEHALNLNPEYALAHYNLGYTLNELKRYSEAIPHLQQALRLMPDLPEAHNHLGVSLGSTGYTEQAVVHFRQAVQLDPKWAEVRKNLALGLAHMGNYPLAIEQYKEAIRLKPSYWAAYSGLAETLAIANRPNEAIAVAEQGIRGARAAGQQAEADSIEAWLRSYLNSGGSQPTPEKSPRR